MIRAFTVFCKLNFIRHTDLELFNKATQDFSKEKLPYLVLQCPHCGAKRPQWSEFDPYERYLISYENGVTITRRISVPRIMCSSCGHTHAVLPEIIVPYKPHSLIFVLTVLRDYYLSRMTVGELCAKYMIAVSTLYAWKRLFLIHKRLWLGILEDLTVKPLTFLALMPSPVTSNELALFFQNQARSFMQGSIKIAHFSSA